MELESGKQVDRNEPPEAEAKTSEGRRKLIRGALVATPVFVALKSTSALAYDCKQPSGFSTSGNLSRIAAGAEKCSPAQGPRHWYSNIGSSQFKDKTTNDVFADGGTRKLKEIITTNSGTNLEKFIVSAYLDLMSAGYGFAPGVDFAEIKKMWTGRTTTYSPGNTGLLHWSPYELENYLRYTMGMKLV